MILDRQLCQSFCFLGVRSIPPPTIFLTVIVRIIACYEFEILYGWFTISNNSSHSLHRSVLRVDSYDAQGKPSAPLVASCTVGWEVWSAEKESRKAEKGSFLMYGKWFLSLSKSHLFSVYCIFQHCGNLF